MSLIRRFAGRIDAPEPGANHVFALVYGTENAPTIGFVTIPIKCFPKGQQDKLVQDAKIEGRFCPRAMRVRMV